MKVFENIEIFHRERGANGKDVVVSDEEFRQGLKTIVEGVIPYRLDAKKSISAYNKMCEEVTLMKKIGETENFFCCDIGLGRRELDIAMLKVIYNDRYSFGHIYWELIQSLKKEQVEIERFIDPEAPFLEGLIEYAVKYDLAKTVDEIESLSSLDERYEHAQECLRRSQGEVLIKHKIKDEYEDAVSILIERCRQDIEKVHNHVAIHLGDRALSESMEIQESGKEGQQKRVGDTPFAHNHVRKEENKERLMTYLHEKIKDRANQDALVYIQAAIEAGLITKPKYSHFINEFGDKCSKSSYYALVKAIGPSDAGGNHIVGESFKQKRESVQLAVKELKEMFK